MKIGLLVEIVTMIMGVLIPVMFISIGLDNSLKNSSRIVQVESFYVISVAVLMLIGSLCFWAAIWISRFVCK